ncbi:hypothetical protein K438DRAFT_839331 [Mycena galopus ATCC 62051]|nr:hypothetical protein K438DRAFT_839331 [Mycena galopus ATCC 62051]
MDYAMVDAALQMMDAAQLPGTYCVVGGCCENGEVCSGGGGRYHHRWRGRRKWSTTQDNYSPNDCQTTAYHHTRSAYHYPSTTTNPHYRQDDNQFRLRHFQCCSYSGSLRLGYASSCGPRDTKCRNKH